MIRITLAAVFLLAGELTCAQVYSWKNPSTGKTNFSNIAPSWYSRGETVSGPRVIKTSNGRVVDDTALSYEDRLLLSGKSNEYIENLRLQKAQGFRIRQDSIRDSTKTEAQNANRHSAEAIRSDAESARKKGS